MKDENREYARAGVDYTKMEPFKQMMIETGKETVRFPNRRGVFLNADLAHAHGACFQYRGDLTHMWCQTQEGLGNKNWIAEWMYQFEGKGTYYKTIGIDNALMAANDVIAQGAMPVIFTNEVAAGDSEWFEDKQRSRDLANGYYDVCQMCGMALAAGESPSLRYLIKSEPPVKSAPSLSCCVTGIIAPLSRLITGSGLAAGDCIIGAPSSGLHANGISLIIKRAMSLPDKFLTELGNGFTLGEEALVPTRCYVQLIEALQEAEADIHALLPGTGSGIAKIAFDKRPFTYRINDWVEVPEIFRFMREIGVPLRDCLTMFNWGIGYYLYVPPDEADYVIEIGKESGYDLVDLGQVEKGDRKVVFEPEKITLPPPGD